MKIVIDEKIPFLKDALMQMGHTVWAMPGSKISHADLLDAGALFVRTRTRCDADLLGGTGVRFIGTATIGYDHIDSTYCRDNGIVWKSAPGCNADAVLQYVQSAIYTWVDERNVTLDNLVLGVVGVGHIGSRVACWAREKGAKVLLNDPPRAERGDKGFVDLENIAAECDIITFHTTYERRGVFPTHHLADDAFLNSLRRKPLLINTSRGAVVDNSALLKALEENMVCDAVLDVWEDEPLLNIPLLNKAYIATPHIAGYSAEGKLNASRMMLQDFSEFISHQGDIPEISLPAPDCDTIYATSESDAMLRIYSPKCDSGALKRNPEKFEDLRNNYKLRREPSAFKIVIKQH